MKNENQLQQGDINFERIKNDVDKKTLCKVQKNGWVLAEGETTGHFHRIEEVKKAEMYEYYDDYLKEDCLLLKILENQVEVKHNEHQSIILDRGIYRVTRVNEYDPFEKYSRKVQD
jgi:hypothetical protein